MTTILGRLSGSSLPIKYIEARVSAGFPSPAEEYAETSLSIDELVDLRAPSVYLVRAGGDSLTGIGIYDSDVLIVDRALTPQAGDVVVALVRGEFTAKILGYEGGRPLL
jgi:DNA polymerase V